MAITSRSGKNLVDRPSKKNPELQVQLVPQQVENKNVDNLGKSDYPKIKIVEQVNEIPQPPFPQRLKKAKEDTYFKKLFDIFKDLHINFPLLDIFQGMPQYTKYLKDAMTNMIKLHQVETVALTEECSLVAMRKMPKNLKVPRSFTLLIQ